MSNIGILIAFGLLVLIAVGSRVLYARHSLSTLSRILMSAVAVALLIVGLLRERGLDAGGIAIVAVTVATLGAGVYVLWRWEHHPPSGQ